MPAGSIDAVVGAVVISKFLVPNHWDRVIRLLLRPAPARANAAKYRPFPGSCDSPRAGYNPAFAEASRIREVPIPWFSGVRRFSSAVLRRRLPRRRRSDAVKRLSRSAPFLYNDGATEDHPSRRSRCVRRPRISISRGETLMRDKWTLTGGMLLSAVLLANGCTCST